MEQVPDNVLVILRVTGAVTLFWISSLFLRKAAPASGTTDSHKTEKIERKDFFRFFLLGVFGVAVNQSLFLKGLHLTSPIDAAIMMITTPILVLIIASLVIREKITLLKFSG